MTNKGRDPRVAWMLNDPKPMAHVLAADTKHTRQDVEAFTPDGWEMLWDKGTTSVGPMGWTAVVPLRRVLELRLDGDERTSKPYAVWHGPSTAQAEVDARIPLGYSCDWDQKTATPKGAWCVPLIRHLRCNTCGPKTAGFIRTKHRAGDPCPCCCAPNGCTGTLVAFDPKYETEWIVPGHPRFEGSGQAAVIVHPSEPSKDGITVAFMPVSDADAKIVELVRTQMPVGYELDSDASCSRVTGGWIFRLRRAQYVSDLTLAQALIDRVTPGCKVRQWAKDDMWFSEVLASDGAPLVSLKHGTREACAAILLAACCEAARVFIQAQWLPSEEGNDDAV
jgi:hypothetical protein